MSCGTELVLLLMRLRHGLDDNNYQLLRSYLSPAVSDSVDQGWEEVTLNSTNHLLQTLLNKAGGQGAKDAAPVQSGATLLSMKDTAKLRGNIKKVNDRLAKGMRPFAPAVPKKDAAAAAAGGAAAAAGGAPPVPSRRPSDAAPPVPPARPAQPAPASSSPTSSSSSSSTSPSSSSSSSFPSTSSSSSSSADPQRPAPEVPSR